MEANIVKRFFTLCIFLCATNNVHCQFNCQDDEVCEYPDEEVTSNPVPNCEVGLINLAVHQPVKQSSQRYDASAERAVDGDRNQFFIAKSCSHTAEYINDEVNDSTPWLVVDLGAESIIHHITLYPRDDPCCANRYHDIQIRVGNDLEYGLNNVFSRNALCGEIFGGGYKQGHIFNFTCSQCLNGRYVSVQIVRECQNCVKARQDSNSNILSICEFEVYGLPNK